MINLIQGDAKRSLEFHKGKSNFGGVLRTPSDLRNPEEIIELGIKYWAMDNGCFQEYKPHKIIRMMELYRDIPNCLFMVVPDVVGNHDETLIMFRAWLGTIQSYGFPIAFVLQDGVKIEEIPFDSIQSIFIGGSTEFKYTAIVRDIVKIAKSKGKWVHCGRVNSIRRIIYMKSIGCDSIDGSGYSRFMDNCKTHLNFYANDKRQMNFWEISK